MMGDVVKFPGGEPACQADLIRPGSPRSRTRCCSGTGRQFEIREGEPEDAAHVRVCGAARVEPSREALEEAELALKGVITDAQWEEILPYWRMIRAVFEEMIEERQ